jgi:hypothetical protein
MANQTWRGESRLLNWAAGLRRASAESNHRRVAFRSAEPIHRLLHQGRPRLNAASDLCGQFVETLGPKYAGRALVRYRKHRRHGEMEARLKGDGLIYDSKAAIELLELAAHERKATVYREIGCVIVVGAEELSEGSFNERRLACAGTFGRCGQPRGHFF